MYFIWLNLEFSQNAAQLLLPKKRSKRCPGLKNSESLFENMVTKVPVGTSFNAQPHNETQCCNYHQIADSFHQA